MRFFTGRKAATLLALLVFACGANVAGSRAQSPTPPKPMLYLQRVEYVKTGGKEFTRYYFGVENSAAYPDEMFAASFKVAGSKLQVGKSAFNFEL